MNECEKYGCDVAKVGGVTVSTMSASEALAHVSELSGSNRGESWTAAILGKHARHAKASL